MRFFLIFLLLVTGYWLLVTEVTADTLYMADGREVKGIIVEDYKDRLLLSTADGEVTLMKSNIKELRFDTEEENLIKLAELAKDKKEYSRSFNYYAMALKFNPDSKRAKEGVIFLQGYLFRKEESEKESAIKKQEDFERGWPVIESERDDEAEFKGQVARLARTTGMAIVLKGGFPKIENVRPDFPAYEAGIRKGDILAAMWGRLTGYMSLKEVLKALLEPGAVEIKCTIERPIDVQVGSNGSIGATLKMEFAGLTVSDAKTYGPAYNSDVRKDDLIVGINDKSTRYMPLNKAMDEIKHSRGRIVKLIIRRETIIWRDDSAL